MLLVSQLLFVRVVATGGGAGGGARGAAAGTVEFISQQPPSIHCILLHCAVLMLGDAVSALVVCYAVHRATLLFERCQCWTDCGSW